MCSIGESWWSKLIRKKAPWHQNSSLKCIRAAPSSGKKYFSCNTPSFSPPYFLFFFFLTFFFFPHPLLFLNWRIQVFQIVQDMGQFPSDNRWPNATLFRPLSSGGGAGAHPADAGQRLLLRGGPVASERLLVCLPAVLSVSRSCVWFWFPTSDYKNRTYYNHNNTNDKK